MGVMLDGKAESMRIKARLTARVSRITQGAKPGLSVVLVGNNPASETYATIKKRFGETVGVNVRIHRITNQELRITNQSKYLRQLIQHLNRSKKVHGILLQLPLPRGFNAQEHIDLIDRRKDVDGLRRDSLVHSPVAEAVRHLLRIALRKPPLSSPPYQGGDRVGVKGVLLVKSVEFGNSLLKSLKDFPVEWDVVRVFRRERFETVPYTTKKYDIVVSALGYPHAIMPNMIKRGSVILDVGFTKTKDSIKGDFHPDCYKKSSFYSPVPGGIGPLTVAYVFRNLMKLRAQL